MSEGRGLPFYKWWTIQHAMFSMEISPRAVTVLLRLLDHYNHSTGQCNPSQFTLAEALNCSDRTIRNAIAELRALGLIKVIEGPGVLDSNFYEINFFKGDKHAYRQAEKTCLLRRKNSSGKPKKEPKKQQLRKKAVRTSQEKATDALQDKRGIANTRARLERAVVQRIGDAERGYLVLGSLGDEMLDAVAAAVASGERAFGTAVNQLLDASYSLGGGDGI